MNAKARLPDPNLDQAIGRRTPSVVSVVAADEPPSPRAGVIAVVPGSWHSAVVVAVLVVVCAGAAAVEVAVGATTAEVVVVVVESVTSGVVVVGLGVTAVGLEVTVGFDVTVVLLDTTGLVVAAVGLVVTAGLAASGTDCSGEETCGPAIATGAGTSSWPTGSVGSR